MTNIYKLYSLFAARNHAASKLKYIYVLVSYNDDDVDDDDDDDGGGGGGGDDQSK